jgi:hypothetical protein
VDVSQKLARDLAILPPDAALLGQCSGLNLEPLTVRGIVTAALAQRTADNAAPGRGGNGGGNQPDARKLERQATAQVLKVVERVGNLRVDGVTVGFNYVKDNAGPEKGWLALVLRGQYDRGLMVDAVKSLIGKDAEVAVSTEAGDAIVIALGGGQGCVILPNNETAILIAAPNDKESLRARESILAALKAGKAVATPNEDLAPLMKLVNTKSPVWLVSKLTDVMRDEAFDGAFKTLTLDTKLVKEGTEFTIKAEALDEDKAKSTVAQTAAEVNSDLQEAKKELARRPSLQPAVDLLGSIKVQAEGTGTTMTGLVPKGIMNAVIGELPILDLGLGGIADEVAPPVDIAPAPQLPVPPLAPEIVPAD